ncbi:MAG: hypothetical protein LCH56_07715 [Proteobacteria bacterium]|nr:hypothetical protein [Pseudomonadota bacterium]
MNENRKLAEIQTIVAMWRRPGNALTSYEAMSEIRDVLAGLPRPSTSAVYDDQMPAPKALRGKSPFLG